MRKPKSHLVGGGVGRKGCKKDPIDYLPTLEECMSSPSRVRQILSEPDDSIIVATAAYPLQHSPPHQLDTTLKKPSKRKRSFKSQRRMATTLGGGGLEGSSSEIDDNLKGDSLMGLPGPDSNHLDLKDAIPLGTPVLALWRKEYYPAIVIDYKGERRGRRYRVKYCDNILRWLSRKNLVLPNDSTFNTVPIPNVDIINELIKDSQSRQTLKGIIELENILEEHWPVLEQVLLGSKYSWRRNQFFKSQRERSHLHHEVRTGPLTFEEYYSLSDMIVNRVTGLVQREEGGAAGSPDGGIVEAFKMNIELPPDDNSIMILLRQFSTMVLLPELIINYLFLLYEGCEPEEKLRELTTDDNKDYVDYLLSKRDIVRWGRQKIK